MPTSNETPNRHDVIIIGAGIIGCAIALSMTRKGYKTLNVDALPAAGYGSTSSSAAVILSSIDPKGIMANPPSPSKTCSLISFRSTSSPLSSR